MSLFKKIKLTEAQRERAITYITKAGVGLSHRWQAENLLGYTLDAINQEGSPVSLQKHGPFLDVTTDEIVDFIKTFNDDTDVAAGSTELRLDGLFRVLKDPERAIDLMLIVIGARCHNDDQLMACLAHVFAVAASRFETPVTAERLIKALEVTIDTEKEMNEPTPGLEFKNDPAPTTAKSVLDFGTSGKRKLPFTNG